MVPVTDAATRERYRKTILARIGWEPEEPRYHLFAVDIDSAGFVIFGEGQYAAAWDLARGYRRLPLAIEEESA
jgi:hypothetical protein